MFSVLVVWRFFSHRAAAVRFCSSHISHLLLHRCTYAVYYSVYECPHANGYHRRFTLLSDNICDLLHIHSILKLVCSLIAANINIDMADRMRDKITRATIKRQHVPCGNLDYKTDTPPGTKLKFNCKMLDGRIYDFTKLSDFLRVNCSATSNHFQQGSILLQVPVYVFMGHTQCLAAND